MAGDIIVVERTLLKAEVFRHLSAAALIVYMDFLMKRKMQGMKIPGQRKKIPICKNNGEIEYCYSEAEKKGFTRPRFARALDELVEKGFLDISHSGAGGYKGDKSLYAISERWTAFGTENFIVSNRPKDTRSGRGFRRGNTEWAKRKKRNHR